MELVMKVGTLAKESSLLTDTMCMVWCALSPFLFFGFNHYFRTITI